MPLGVVTGLTKMGAEFAPGHHMAGSIPVGVTTEIEMSAAVLLPEGRQEVDTFDTSIRAECHEPPLRRREVEIIFGTPGESGDPSHQGVVHLIFVGNDQDDESRSGHCNLGVHRFEETRNAVKPEPKLPFFVFQAQRHPFCLDAYETMPRDRGLLLIEPVCVVGDLKPPGLLAGGWLVSVDLSRLRWLITSHPE